MRKIVELKIEPSASGRANRDAGKTFVLTEMPAVRAEKWAAKAFLAMDGVRLDAPAGIKELGIVGIYLIMARGFSGAKFEAVEPLMDEMMTCVSFRTSADVVRPLGGDDDIEEVSTLSRIRQELLELHAGFTFAELASILKTQASATANLQNTETSRD